MNSLINSVLANLEEAACFRHLEVVVAALLNTRPLHREDINLRSRDEHKIIYVNDVYPRCDFRCSKKSGKMVIEMTSLLKLKSHELSRFRYPPQVQQLTPQDEQKSNFYEQLIAKYGRRREVELPRRAAITLTEPEWEEEDE